MSSSCVDPPLALLFAEAMAQQKCNYNKLSVICEPRSFQFFDSAGRFIPRSMGPQQKKKTAYA